MSDPGNPRLPVLKEGGGASGCGCGGSCDSPAQTEALERGMSRRQLFGALGQLGAGALAVGASGCSSGGSGEAVEKASLNWEEYFKGNFREMTADERRGTVERLERLWELEHGSQVAISDAPPLDRVLYGYAFNISKCQGYMDCVKACVEENNLDRKSGTQYIRIFEMADGEMKLGEADGAFYHEVPAAGHYYLGTQCFQCANPPCTKVCPVGATWMEPDGIVVVDYDWCIGCRYCEAACPYWARRFNWHEPEVPLDEVNLEQHYLGNRLRRKGVMEKCTFCIQRTRKGRLPACAEACPTGARVFGNLLDPDSEIRWVLANKRVFRLKEDLGTEPKFWYFMD